MKSEERRKEIIGILKRKGDPIAAKDLASRFHVSRQVIVQDMAVIRASMSGIISTNRGYVMRQDAGCSREFKVRHGEEDVERELNIIVDCGGCVKNVSISHRVYGRISAEMEIRSRQDVREFIEALRDSKSNMLGTATSGYHYHLVEALSEERLDLIERELDKAGFLVELLPWEEESKGA